MPRKGEWSCVQSSSQSPLLIQEMKDDLSPLEEGEGVGEGQLESKPKSEAYLEIACNPALLLQLSNWILEERAHTQRVDRKKMKRAFVQNEIYQLLGFYFVFQGIILVGLAQASKLTSKHWWSPFFLSLVATITTIFAISHKLHIVYEIDEEIAEACALAIAINDNICLLKKQGSTFDLNHEEPELKGSCDKDSILPYAISIIFTLIVFSTLILTSCYTMLSKRCKCD